MTCIGPCIILITEELRSHVDHSVPSVDEFKDEWSYTSNSPHLFTKCRGTNLTFLFSISIIVTVTFLLRSVPLKHTLYKPQTTGKITKLSIYLPLRH